jgi:CRP-like cAMP-binding protein/membrane protease YdiL (CAAX protease family)
VDTRSLLRQSVLGEGLTEEELERVLRWMGERRCQPGEALIREGAQDRDLFLLVEGRAEVVRGEEGSSARYRLAELGAGEVCGELAFIDRAPRSSSVIALEPVRALVLEESAWSLIERDAQLFAKIYRNIAARLSDRLRSSNDVVVQSLEKELAVAKLQVFTGNFMVVFLILLPLYVFAIHSMQYLTRIFGNPLFVTVPVSLVILAAFIWVARKSGYPWSFFGLTLRNWRQAVMEAIASSFVILGLGTLGKWWLLSHHPTLYGEALFEFGRYAFSTPSTTQAQIIALTMYGLVTIPIQELLAHGVIQSTLQVFLLGKWRYTFAIIITALVFGMTHLILSPLIALVTFVLGLLWGWLYKRHGTLIGVILSHFLVGVGAFFVIGVQKALQIVK